MADQVSRRGRFTELLRRGGILLLSGVRRKNISQHVCERRRIILEGNATSLKFRKVSNYELPPKYRDAGMRGLQFYSFKAVKRGCPVHVIKGYYSISHVINVFEKEDAEFMQCYIRQNFIPVSIYWPVSCQESSFYY